MSIALARFFSSMNQGAVILRITPLSASTSFNITFTSAQAFSNSYITSDGIRAEYVNGFTATFASAGAKWIDILANLPADINAISLGTAVISFGSDEIGTFDFSKLTGITNVNATSSGCFKFIGTATGQLITRSTNMIGKTLDLSNAKFNTLIGNGSNFTDLLLPTGANATSVQSLNLGSNGFVNKVLPFTGLVNLIICDLSQSIGGSSIDTIDISMCPLITSFNLNNSGVKQLLLTTTGNVNTLKTLNIQSSRLSARFGGNMLAFTNSLAYHIGTTTIGLGIGGFTEDELSSIINAFWSTRASRTQTGLKILTLADTSYFGAVYPITFTNSSGINAYFTKLIDRNKIEELSNIGFAISHNKSIVMSAIGLTTTTVRLTYTNTSIIDIWQIGDTITLSSSDAAKIASGNYTVIAGSGKIWDITANNTVITAISVGVDADVIVAPLVISQNSPLLRTLADTKLSIINVSNTSTGNDSWVYENNIAYNGGTGASNVTDGKGFRFKFRGTAFTLSGAKNATSGNFTVMIDGVAQGSGSCYNATSISNATYYISPNMTAGLHEVIITKLTSANNTAAAVGNALLLDTITFVA